MTSLSRYVLCLGAAAALLAACGGSQQRINMSGTLPSLSVLHVAPTQSQRNHRNYRVIFDFGGNAADGVDPIGGLAALNGTLYGTTYTGGQGDCGQGCGTIFSIGATGKLKLLHTFDYAEGAHPMAELIAMNGTLFGTTAGGGKYGGGTIFSVTPNGTEKVLHSFGNGEDGGVPSTGLVVVDHTLYGTTSKGGDGTCSGGCGTVFSISTGGSEAVIHSFHGSPDGADPEGTLLNVAGTLYGTTAQGGNSANRGTVFSVSTAGKEKVLFRFAAKDGRNPDAGLVAVKTTLYGTTYLGGSKGYGTVFSISTTGADERVLHNFSACCLDGFNPWARLFVINGKLYGTTWAGGTGRSGTLFSVDERTAAEKVLHNFGVNIVDADSPRAGLTQLKGELYGTAGGGRYGAGAIFRIRMP